MNAPDINHAANEGLAGDFRSVMGFVDDLFTATGKTGAKLNAVGAKLGETLEEARLKVGDAQALIVENTKEAARATDQYVHEHPWKSIGIAAGIGLFLGLLISRR